MDGKQAKLTASLQFRLALSLMVVIAMAAVLAGAIGFRSAFHDANELQDDQLREIAAMVDAKRLELGQVDPIVRSGQKDKESRVALQLLDDVVSQNGVSTEPGVAFPSDLEDGMQTVEVHRKKWRVFVMSLDSGKRLVVGQRTAVRDEIAKHAGIRTVMPMMFLIPFLIVLMVVVLRYMLAPMTRLSREIDGCTRLEMAALDDQGLPSELKPFIASINHMLQRLAEAMEQQRRFVADAAHELRSPLTALSLQAENLAANELTPEARIQLNALGSGLARARALVNQLLTLARAQLASPDETSAIALESIVREVFEDLMPLAEAKQMDLGLEQGSEVRVAANGIDLSTIMRNLVDNAIRYSDVGGRVDVRLFVQEKWAVMTVQDHGPGIPESERERVFDPFYRLSGSGESGSGLGLSIVKSIVTRLQGEVSISRTSSFAAHGTIVSVKLPVYPAATIKPLEEI